MVGGRQIVRGDSKGSYWRYNYYWKQLYLSSYHISPKTAADFISAIIQFDSRWIVGYGSAIALLGEWLVNNPQSRPNVQAVVTSGDTLWPEYRQSIEEGFGCKVYDYYGSHEGALIISECEEGRLHVQPESGILEILDELGNPCAPGEVGEMVVTGLLNDAMPLIRYRTGDMAAWSLEKECPCGRQSLLISHIEGRVDDYLLLPDGRKIGRLSTAIKKTLNIRSAQIAQDALDHVWLLILPDENYHSDDGKLIQEDITSRIGNFSVDIVTTDVIPKMPSGKQRLVVRLFDRPYLAQLYKQQLPDLEWKC
jgi:phenylacetate-CoA ligase